jgi:signal transduction histidine kinase
MSIVRRTARGRSICGPRHFVTGGDTCQESRHHPRDSMRFPRISLRWLLGAVAVLASLMFAVSIFSLGRLIRMSGEQRLERGRDLVQTELARSAAEPDPAEGPARFAVLGIRGGLVGARGGEGALIQSGVSREVDRALSTLAVVARADSAEIGTIDVDDGTVFLGARRRADGRVLWAAYTVLVPKFLGMWRTTVMVLTSATVLLGVLAMIAVASATSGARALTRSLSALEEDLSAVVARPVLAELASVADGVASLARSLADAQREREVLSIELGRRERLAALGRVVAGVAHEIRNPLASMKLRVDVARTSEDVPAAVVAELEAVEEEIVRLDRLVTDFLVVSGRRIGRRVDSDLGDLARRRVAQLAPWARELGVSLAVEGSARAVVDPEACARAVDNLVKNAVEASPHGAEVRVRIEGRAEGAAMAVEDRGPGVPDERVPELFEPFFTTKPDGTGLGLAVSRAIAVASGGTLTYQRLAGVTRFELALSTEAAPS